MVLQWEELSTLSRIDLINDVAIDILGDDNGLSDEQKENIIDKLDLENSTLNPDLIYDVLDFMEIGEDY